jgi:predicted metal-dependent phosphoesterase TrpH
MRSDLHLHSTASDGADTPLRVMELAAEVGLEAVALTDHDTLAGIAEAHKAAHRFGIRFLPGVELSVDHHGTKMHMLTYGIEPGSGPLQDELGALRDGRDARNVRIVEALQALGYEITLEDVLVHAHGPSVGRPHIADALITKGYIESREEAFAELLHDGGSAYFPRARLTATEAIELADASGGVCVIAHPATINLRSESFVEVFRELADCGLGGIEAHHPLHNPALRTHLTGLAHDLGLIPTGGSDYHGEGKRPFSVGVGTGNLRVPPDAFAAIEDSCVQKRNIPRFRTPESS